MPHYSMEPFEHHAWIESALAGYIRAQSLRYRARANALAPDQKNALAGYFSQVDLERAHIFHAADERIAEPAFYARLRALGTSDLPDFSLMQAVTFDDVVVACMPIDKAVLFHELVHVTQYRLLGVEKFASLYVREFLASGGYESIPLEVCARHLSTRYIERGGLPDIEAVVLEWIDAGYF